MNPAGKTAQLFHPGRCAPGHPIRVTAGVNSFRMCRNEADTASMKTSLSGFLYFRGSAAFLTGMMRPHS